MLPIFDDAGNRIPWPFNGIVLNTPTYMVETVQPITGMVATMEQHPESDGVESYGARKGAKVLRASGLTRAPTYAALFDAIDALAGATDPARLSHEGEGTTEGYLPLTFSVPTTDTANYATGFIPCFYNVRLRAPLDPMTSRYIGLACPFSLDFMLADPRRYFATVQTRTGAGTAANALASYHSWPTLTITMSVGAGNAAYTITNTPTSMTAHTLVLNLSTMAGTEVVVVDMEKRKITVDGTENAALYVSGDYFRMEPTANVITISNNTNAAGVLSWYRGFAS